MSAPSFITVFMAGMLAFASPCVLPLLPGYLALMTGQIASPQSPTTQSRPVVASLAFVLSFTTIFVAMGATASSLARLMLAHRVPLERTAGAAVALMGLATLGVTRLPLFYRDLRLHPHPPPGPCGSAMLGAAFALGWSPCIGPTLAAALAVAAGQASGSAWQGGFLLATYSAGLGAPFVALAVGAGRTTTLARDLRRHGRAVNAVSGLLLIGLGVLMILGQFEVLSIAASGGE